MSDYSVITSFIQNICDDVLRGLFKQHQHGDVILPFIVLRRLDCVLEGNKEEIIKVHNEYKDKFDDTSKIIHSKLNLKFSNYSKFDLKKLKDEPSKLFDNLTDYLDSFSTNVRDIIHNFGLQEHVEKLDQNNKLYLFVEKFSTIDLHPSVIDNHDMGNIFEELLRRFSEMSNETSGEHYTPRDIVNLLVSLVFYPDKEKFSDPNKIISVYDPCCGTGGMLTIGKDWIFKNINNKIDINLFGQELNPITYSICKSDFLITDEEPENIKFGSTLTNDQHSNENRKFDYIISNPPFGVNWKSEKNEIINESKELGGRFSVGIPKVTDGSLLFLQHMISKMETQGSRIGVVFNYSPLYSGDIGKGESNIRKYLIEKDLIETIVQLPDHLFFNTPITTFLWVLNNKKENKRKNKIQLINGRDEFVLLRKRLNWKRKELNEKNITKILKEYSEFKETETSKILDSDEFFVGKFKVNGSNLDKYSKFENIPLNKDILQTTKDLNIELTDLKPTEVGVEINFEKYFYNYVKPTKTDDLLKLISDLDDKILKL